MTYIIKHMNDGRVGIYDTLKACFPIAGPELREAGISRIDGDDERGWFKKASLTKAETIAKLLNDFHGHDENPDTKPTSKGRTTKKQAATEDDLAHMGAALIADQAGA